MKQTIRFLVLVFFFTVAIVPKETFAADSSREAILSSYQGTVEVKLAGGKKSITAFKDMHLSQGDEITTGANSWAILQFSNSGEADDQFILEENTTLSLTKVSNKEGTITKVTLKKGNAWVDVASIKNSEDEFELETPNGLMSVRGTNFFVGVDPNTGESVIGLFSGVVNFGNQESNPDMPPLLYPSMSALLNGSSDQVGQMSNVTLQQMLQSSSPEVIDAILGKLAKINEENQQMLDQQRNNGQSVPQSTNLDRIPYALLNEMLSTGKITQEQYNRQVANISEGTNTPPSPTLDTLNNGVELKFDQSKREERLKDAPTTSDLIKEMQRKKEEQDRKNEEARKEQEAQALQKFLEDLSPEEKAELLQRQALLKDNQKAPVQVPVSNPVSNPQPEPGQEPEPGPEPEPGQEPEPGTDPELEPDENAWFYELESPLGFEVEVNNEPIPYTNVDGFISQDKLVFETTEPIVFNNGDRVTFLIPSVYSDVLEIRSIAFEDNPDWEFDESKPGIPIERVFSQYLTFTIDLAEKDSVRTVEVVFKILASNPLEE
ncbi:MAG TPA: FecR domain-containing protein [Ureibacillus sp.]|nr:FecR domain-containing protein [Ureibacillus sp.]